MLKFGIIIYIKNTSVPVFLLSSFVLFLSLPEIKLVSSIGDYQIQMENIIGETLFAMTH